MHAYLDCIPCLLAQTLRAGRIATDDEIMIKRLLDEVGMMIKELSFENTPPESAERIYAKVREITGVRDPYRKIKEDNTRKVLGLVPSLKKRIEQSGDQLMAAVKMAIAGNVMDFGIDKTFDIEREIDEVLDKDFAINDYGLFKAYLNEAKEVLYVGDNAGESVFDRMLIEQMGKPTTYVVRGTPVINDVTLDDAFQAGIHEVATVISSGIGAPGTYLKKCEQSFVDKFRNSNFIISKGQGNYEGLSNEAQPIFFMLKAKCRVIADDIGVNEGDIILRGINIPVR